MNLNTSRIDSFGIDCNPNTVAPMCHQNAQSTFPINRSTATSFTKSGHSNSISQFPSPFSKYLVFFHVNHITFSFHEIYHLFHISIAKTLHFYISIQNNFIFLDILETNCKNFTFLKGVQLNNKSILKTLNFKRVFRWRKNEERKPL